MSDKATSSAGPVGVVGLGSMGFGMAGSLVAAGLDTYGFDVASAAVERFVAAGGKSGELQDLAGRFSCVVLVVLNAPQTEQILFGPCCEARQGNGDHRLRHRAAGLCRGYGGAVRGAGTAVSGCADFRRIGKGGKGPIDDYGLRRGCRFCGSAAGA